MEQDKEKGKLFDVAYDVAQFIFNIYVILLYLSSSSFPFVFSNV